MKKLITLGYHFVWIVVEQSIHCTIYHPNKNLEKTFFTSQIFLDGVQEIKRIFNVELKSDSKVQDVRFIKSSFDTSKINAILIVK